MKKVDTLINSIAASSKEHASIPFWSWNDKLKKEELLAQIERMDELGMRGFFMHARGGLETEYLSEEWFDAIRFCIEEAKKRGMEAWAYDENGWPSGFAGGELLKDPKNHACELKCEELAEFPTADEDILGVYVVDNDGAKRCEKECGAKSYTVIRRARDFSYVDTMNPDITKEFIAITHERYKKEIGEAFGGAMPGFFTDEPQYFRYGIPWSDTFRTTFKEKYGYDVLDGLPALFFKYDGYREFRYDYYLLCHESFYNGFMKPIYEWCDANGVMLTGHGIEEWGLAGQMKCCGGIMPFYLYEHIPGIDYLSRVYRDMSAPKQLGSVCAQAGKKVALSEMFALCGWDVTPRELKRIAELQFAGGVNLICEHLYAYSVRGQRKRDFPNFYSEHNPWQKYYSEFEKHFSNLGAALSQGRELADTLVIHPIRSAYLDYSTKESGSIKGLDDKYAELVEQLMLDGISYHFGDEGIMRDMGAVVGSCIRVGECIYDKVVIPYCYTLDSSTVGMLKEYLANGGKLYLYGETPTRIDGRVADLSFLKSNITYDELKASSGIRVRHNGERVPFRMQVRITSAGRLIFIANVSDKEYLNTEITVRDCKGLEIIVPATLERKPVRGKINSNGSVTALLDFGDSCSYLLVESDAPMLDFEVSVPKKYISLNAPLTFDVMPENMIRLDMAQLSLDGGDYTEARPVVRIKDNLFKEHFEGTVAMKYTFETEFIPSALTLVVEPMKYTDVRVNGTSISFGNGWRIDRRFKAADIASLVRIGENTVELSFDYYQREEVYRVLYGGGNEALRNCLAFDTEIEPIYLYGDFAVNSRSEFYACESGTVRTSGAFVLCKRSKSVKLDDIVCNGYPFFAGDMRVNAVLNYRKGDPTCLKFSGRMAVCGVEINGNNLGVKLFDDEFELADYLREGENRLTLIVCFSNRNLMGPHHRPDPEPTHVTPKVLSFEKEWDGAACEQYVQDYAFVRFGAEFL